MPALPPEMDVRLRKVRDLRTMNINPYPESYPKIQSMNDLRTRTNDSFRSIEEIIPSPGDDVSTAGRIVLLRSMGRLTFAQMQDSSGRIQIMFASENCNLRIGDHLVSELPNPDGTTISAYKFVQKYIDMGDFIGIRGELFRTHK